MKNLNRNHIQSTITTGYGVLNGINPTFIIVDEFSTNALNVLGKVKASKTTETSLSKNTKNKFRK